MAAIEIEQYINFEQPEPTVVATKTPWATVFDNSVQRTNVPVRTQAQRPKELLLGTINHCDFRVTKAIPVHLDVRGDTVIASWRQIDEFGTGKWTSLACDDLGHTIAELYVSLQADESHLGPDLAKVWAVLKEHVVQVVHRP